MIKVILVTTDGKNVSVELPESFILELVKNICLNGQELVITNKEVYRVKGLVFGQLKDSILIL